MNIVIVPLDTHRRPCGGKNYTIGQQWEVGGRVEKDDMNEWSPLSLCLVGLNICNIFMQLYFILLS